LPLPTPFAKNQRSREISLNFFPPGKASSKENLPAPGSINRFSESTTYPVQPKEVVFMPHVEETGFSESMKRLFFAWLFPRRKRVDPATISFDYQHISKVSA